MDNRGSSSSPPSDGTVFTGALELPAGQRAAFVAEACAGDAEQRARIEALLQAHREAPAFLKTVTRAAAAAGDPAGPGDHIGRYKLLLKLGEGGCGVVYMAEQEEPVRRRVALKIIKAGMDTREVVARFEAERQALAMMDHPGIARVLDGGATASGRPYFVMELVRGVTITKYCNESTLSTRARVELFIQVCHAVQHAHQKGVIHRDIKPSNILVTLHDKVAAPKVIDFGIAKATHGRLTDATLFTAFAQFLGTPAYMSPEQAEMTGLDIDTRSDVYSLGVLLYELLTGRLPFDPKSLQNPSLDEVRRIIREVEPKKPSTHLDTLADADRRTIAGQRATDPAKLRMLLVGDLDWIVLKALEKNRARRYETPAALADDIARHLQDEPVMARPPGTLYRIGKFTRRHRVGVVAGAAVLLALVAGTIASTLQAVRAVRAERAANAERTKAVAARTRADGLLEFMIDDLRTELKKLGRLDLLDRVGEKATAYFASLDPRDLDDASLLRQAKILRQLGEVQSDKALYVQAMESFMTARNRAASLVARHPRNGDMLFERGQAEYWIGRVHRRRGELGAMAEWWTRYRDTGMELVALDPSRSAWQEELAWGLHNLAIYDMDCGRVAEARSGFRAELDSLAKLTAGNGNDFALRFRVIDTNSWLGSLEELSGNFDEAGRRFSRQIVELEAIMVADPQNTKWRSNLADALAFRSMIHAIKGERARALELRRRATEMFAALVANDPDNGKWQASLETSRVRHARLLMAEGARRDAEDLLAPSILRLEKMVAAEPADVILAAALAAALRIQAEILEGSGKPGAMALLERGIELGERGTVKGSPKPELIGEVARTHLAAAWLAQRAHNELAAVQHGHRAQELLGAAKAIATHWQILDATARAHGLLGETDRAGAIVARLQALGYVPLEPWPFSLK